MWHSLFTSRGRRRRARTSHSSGAAACLHKRSHIPSRASAPGSSRAPSASDDSHVPPGQARCGGGGAPQLIEGCTTGASFSANAVAWCLGLWPAFALLAYALS